MQEHSAIWEPSAPWIHPFPAPSSLGIACCHWSRVPSWSPQAPSFPPTHFNTHTQRFGFESVWSLISHCGGQEGGFCRCCRLIHPDSPRCQRRARVLAPDSQWGPQGQLGRLSGGQVGGQGHQGSRICAHAQPDGEDPQQEGSAGGSPCPLDVTLGPSLVGLWRRWAAVTQASLRPATPDPCPGPAPTGSFRDSKNREQPLWSTHRGAQVANRNRPLTRCHHLNSSEPHDDPEVRIIPVLQVRKMRPREVKWLAQKY